MKALLGASGGTAASMGAYIMYLVNCFWDLGWEVYLVPEMWRTMIGLTDRKLIRATPELVKGWDKIGGSPIIPSCKNTNVFKYGPKKEDLSGLVKEFCRGFDAIITVGGDGSTAQCRELYETYGIKSIVPLATMDNDIYCFDNVLGFPTAVGNFGETIVSATNDGLTMQRPTIVIAMGYGCGRLLVNATKYALARVQEYGNIDMIQIPESGTSAEDAARFMSKHYKGGAFTAVISEGCAAARSGDNSGQHKQFYSNEYAEEIKKLTGIDCKVIVGDYRQRSGSPIKSDVELANQFAMKTIELIKGNQFNQAIGALNGEVISKPIEEIRKVNPGVDWYSTPSLSLEPVKSILV